MASQGTAHQPQTAVSSSHARAHGYFLGFRFWRCVSHYGPAVIRPISPDASSLSFPATGSKPGMGFDIPPDVHEADGVGCRWRVKATRRAVVGAAVHPRAKNAGGFHEMGPGATGFTPRHPVIIVVAPVSPVDGAHTKKPFPGAPRVTQWKHVCVCPPHSDKVAGTRTSIKRQRQSRSERSRGCAPVWGHENRGLVRLGGWLRSPWPGLTLKRCFGDPVPPCCR